MLLNMDRPLSDKETHLLAREKVCRAVVAVYRNRFGYSEEGLRDVVENQSSGLNRDILRKILSESSH